MEQLPSEDFFTTILEQLHEYISADKKPGQHYRYAVKLVEKWAEDALKNRPKRVSVAAWVTNMVATAMLNGYLTGIEFILDDIEWGKLDLGLDIADMPSPSEAVH